MTRTRLDDDFLKENGAQQLTSCFARNSEACQAGHSETTKHAAVRPLEIPRSAGSIIGGASNFEGDL